MNSKICLALSALALIIPVLAQPTDYQERDRIMKDRWSLVEQSIPDYVGFLEGNCSLHGDTMMISAVIDNTTKESVRKAMQIEIMGYMRHYQKNGWPKKATVHVNATGSRLLGSCDVYGMWVNDGEKTGNMMGYVEKKIDTVMKIYDEPV